jgi:hypothetical protein
MTDIAYAKRAIVKALRTTGIATVTIEYDGEGDSGQIDGIAAWDAKEQPVAIDRPARVALYRGKPASDYTSLREALDDFAWLLLGHFHDGFVNNDGGFGTIRIEVAKRSVILDHDDRLMETINTRTEV